MIKVQREDFDVGREIAAGPGGGGGIDPARARRDPYVNTALTGNLLIFRHSFFESRRPQARYPYRYPLKSMRIDVSQGKPIY